MPRMRDDSELLVALGDPPEEAGGRGQGTGVTLSPNGWRLALFAFLGLLATGFFILEFW